MLTKITFALPKRKQGLGGKPFRPFLCLPKMWETCGKVILRKMPLSYLRGIFERCLAVFELSILIGIITLKSALETATRHFSQLLIRVIPKKCRQMSSSNFLTFQMAIKASYGIIFLANLLTLHYDSLSRNNLKV